MCPSAQPQPTANQDDKEYLKNEKAESDAPAVLEQTEEQEDPYNLNPEDIYDTVDANSTYSPVILNRPPAPIPRPEPESESDKPVICRGMNIHLLPSRMFPFHDKRTTR